MDYSELLKSKDYNRIIEETKGKEDSLSLYARFLALNEDLRGNGELKELALCEKAIENAELEEELKMRGEVSLYEALIHVPGLNNVMRNLYYNDTKDCYAFLSSLLNDKNNYEINTEKLQKAFKYILPENVDSMVLDYYLIVLSYLYVITKNEAYEVMADKLLKLEAYQNSKLPKFIMPMNKEEVKWLLEKVVKEESEEETVVVEETKSYHFGFWDVFRIFVMLLCLVNIVCYIIFLCSEFENWMMYATVIPYGTIAVVSLFHGLYKFMEYFFMNDLRGMFHENKLKKLYVLFLIIYLVASTALFFFAMAKFNFDTSAW